MGFFDLLLAGTLKSTLLSSISRPTHMQSVTRFLRYRFNYYLRLKSILNNYFLRKIAWTLIKVMKRQHFWKSDSIILKKKVKSKLPWNSFQTLKKKNFIELKTEWNYYPHRVLKELFILWIHFKKPYLLEIKNYT